jgi:5-methylcytosine-specific restriction protein A
MLVATYLFAWNPVLWDWPKLPADIRKLKRRGHVDTEWSSGRARNVEPGSRAFLVRLGVPPKGIFGAGTVMTAPVERLHWKADEAAKRKTTNFVMLRLDALFELPQVTFDDLARPPFARYRWAVRQSGTRVPSTLADALETLWERRIAPPLPRTEERPALRAETAQAASRGRAR